MVDSLKKLTCAESGAIAFEFGMLAVLVVLGINVDVTALTAWFIFLTTSPQDVQALSEQQASHLAHKKSTEFSKACEASNRRISASFLKSIHGGELKNLLPLQSLQG